jgi:hypothetical protein
MADQQNEKKMGGGILDMLGSGMVKKAGKDLAGRKAVLDKAEAAAMGDEQAAKDKEYREGRNAGDLPPPKKEPFHF